MLKTILAGALLASVMVWLLVSVSADSGHSQGENSSFEGGNLAAYGDHYMIVRASLERLAPATTTALVASRALIPLAISAGEVGSKILFPVAVVILGGLVSSRLLDMSIPRLVLFQFGRRAAEHYLACRIGDSPYSIPAVATAAALETSG